MKRISWVWLVTLWFVIFIVSFAAPWTLFADDVPGPAPNTAKPLDSAPKEAPKESSPAGNAENSTTNTKGTGAEGKEPQSNGPVSQKMDVDIINHSMGGIVTRAGQQTASGTVRKSVYLASPKFGSAKAFSPESDQKDNKAGSLDEDSFGDELDWRPSEFKSGTPNSRDAQYAAGDSQSVSDQ